MSYFMAPPPWREYVSGLYYNVSEGYRLRRTYLPQVELQAHATVLSTTSRTVLTQTFLNPSPDKWIREVRYAFPLYDGVSVVGFTCQVGDRTIVGEVKEKEKARAVYKDAVARGETAGLLEQLPEASDVFTTTVGNIQPGAKIITKITYLGELKHDMEVDGIRYTIPNVICPRYGDYPGELYMPGTVEAMSTSISITVDAEMADGSFIQKLQSPTHPIAMTMGTLSSAPDADPSMTKASATLTLGTAELDTDFVLQIVAKNTGVPRAMLENHPTIPNHRAVMATLVPKFALPPEKPELVFVCDRSGSMGGTRIQLVVQALKVFLKSLPVGVKFNICSFGSTYSFLWKKSVTYDQQTLDEAVRHADSFDANYGGTEMLKPLKATIEQRYKDMPLDVMLLTDGEIWNQQELFTYLNTSIGESKSPIRLFTLGIGNGVSHALIEGVAKAGNGFSQTVGEGEKMDAKVVRMLKGALSPHISDYSLEVKYAKAVEAADSDDDYEIIEKVTDSLKVQLELKDEKKSVKQKVISLFDTSADPDKDEPPAYDETGESRYAHLPTIPVPKIIQAPQNIPSLFAFNRTTVYLLLGPEAPQATPKSVILRGTSNHGPLELEIPIEVLKQPGETIHQLAAKKAISELEQGRGWLPEAKTPNGKLVKTQFEGRFEEMVEREAVRLGVQFQVGGKWCSFVAVETNSKQEKNRKDDIGNVQYLEDEKLQNDGGEFPKVSLPPNRPSRYVFESDSEDDEDEEVLNLELDELHGVSKRLTKLAGDMGKEIDKQNSMLARLGPCRGCIDPLEGGLAPQKRRLTRVGDDNAHQSTDLTHLPGLQQDGARASSSHADKRGIESVLVRGETIDDLQPKSNDLAVTAKSFYAKKKKSTGVFGNFFGSSSSSSATAAMSSGPAGASLSGGGSLSGSTSPATARRGLFHRSAPIAAPSAPPGGAATAFGSASTAGARKSSRSASRSVLSTANFDSDLIAFEPNFAGSSTAGLINLTSTSKPGAPAPPPPPAPSFGAAPSDSAAFSFGAPQHKSHAEQLQDYQTSLMVLNQDNKKRLLMCRQEQEEQEEESQETRGPDATNMTNEQLTHFLIGLQTFEGFWETSALLLARLQVSEAVLDAEIGKAGANKNVFLTALVIAVFEQKLKEFDGSWELVVDKAKGWLEGKLGGDVEGLVSKAGALVK